MGGDSYCRKGAVCGVKGFVVKGSLRKAGQV